MRVLLPALLPMARPAGVSVYVRELVRAWSGMSSRAPQLTVVAAEPEAFGFVAGDEAVKIWPLGTSLPGVAGRMLALHAAIPWLARRLGADVVMTPNFLSPSWTPGLPTVVVVQDLAFEQVPSSVPFPRRMYYRFAVRGSIRRASAVLVTTRTMAAEVAAFEPSVASRIRTAPLGVSPTHLETGSGRKRPHEGGFLCVGTLEPRKNLARVLSAHGRLCRRIPDFRPLRIVGAAGWGTDEVDSALAGHPDPSRVVRLGFLSDEDLALEYATARALVFCSLYEGFGLPVVEAMAHGCPVLCSSGTALAEVGEGAALTVEPTEVGEIERGLLRMARDDELVGRLGAAGPVRAAQYSWRECARRTIDAIEEFVE